MILKLTGVLPNGAALAPGVPSNPRAALRFIQGSDVVIQLTVVTPDGAKVDLTGGTLQLVARARIFESRELLSIAGVIAAIGRADFTLSNTQTSIDAGVLIYDISFTDSGGAKDFVIPASPLHVGASATLPA